MNGDVDDADSVSGEHGNGTLSHVGVPHPHHVIGTSGNQQAQRLAVGEATDALWIGKDVKGTLRMVLQETFHFSNTNLPYYY